MSGRRTVYAKKRDTKKCRTNKCDKELSGTQIVNIVDRIFFQTSQNVIISLLYDCYLETRDQTFYKLSKSCRLHLLKTLKMLQLNPHPSTPPPTQYSLQIYQMAQNDSDISVTEEAKIGLAEIEKIVHPAAPTLRLPIVVNTKTAENYETDLNEDLLEGVLTVSSIDREGETERVSVSPTVENLDDDRPGDTMDVSIQEESNVQTNTGDTEDVSKSDNSEEDRTNDSTPIGIVEINLDSDMEREDRDLSKDNDSDENVEIMSAPNQKEVNVDSSEVVSSVVDVDEPLRKQQNFENDAESIGIVSNNEPKEGDDGSDDDTTMLNLFCDTIQEEQQ